MIRVSSVTKQYPGNNGTTVTALNNIDLDVEQGDFLVITGPSGSGKSTLLYTIGGLLRPTSGEVILGETYVYSLSATERARLRLTKVGFVFQTFNLVPYLTCIENVALPAILSGRPSREALKHAGDLLENLGLGHRLGHKPADISVGERQRVALSRSLINEPEILLADEPTGNLDPDMSLEVMNLFREVNAKGQTVVMVSHDRGLAQMGQKVMSLNNGEIESNEPLRAEVC